MSAVLLLMNSSLLIGCKFFYRLWLFKKTELINNLSQISIFDIHVLCVCVCCVVLCCVVLCCVVLCCVVLCCVVLCCVVLCCVVLCCVVFCCVVLCCVVLCCVVLCCGVVWCGVCVGGGGCFKTETICDSALTDVSISVWYKLVQIVRVSAVSFRSGISDSIGSMVST